MKRKKTLYLIAICVCNWILLQVLFGQSLGVPLLHAQDNCETALVAAQEKYVVGHTGQVITLLNDCLPSGLPDVQRQQAYILLALAYIAEDFADNAKEAIDKLLDINERFEPDPSQYPLKFTKFVKETKQLRPLSLRSYLLMGIGFGTITIIAVFGPDGLK